MSFNTYDGASISTTNDDTYRTAAHAYNMAFVGLRPNTKHKIYLDGIDYTWAAKGYGQNLGEDILSTEKGTASLMVYFEIPLSRPAQFELDVPNTLSFYSNKVGNQNKRMEDAVNVNWKTWEIRSADGLSNAMLNMHFHIALVYGDVNRIQQHD